MHRLRSSPRHFWWKTWRRNGYYLFYSLLQNLKERERTGRKRTEIRIGIDEIETRSAERKTWNGVETWRKTGTVIETEKGTIKRKNEIRIGTGTETGTGTGIETEIRSLTRPRTSTRNRRIRCWLDLPEDLVHSSCLSIFVRTGREQVSRMQWKESLLLEVNFSTADKCPSPTMKIFASAVNFRCSCYLWFSVSQYPKEDYVYLFIFSLIDTSYPVRSLFTDSKDISTPCKLIQHVRNVVLNLNVPMVTMGLKLYFITVEN